LTQEALGQKVGVSKQTVSRWEKGEDIPQGANLLELTRVLSLPHDWFAGASAKSARGESQGEALDPDARKLADHLARELTAELRNNPERRRELLRHWYGQVKVTRWPARGEPPKAERVRGHG